MAYKFDRATTGATLRRLIAIDGVHLEDEATTRQALVAFEAGSADFADYVVLESARRGGALPLYTFDESLGKSEGTRLVGPTPHCSSSSARDPLPAPGPFAEASGRRAVARWLERFDVPA